MRVEAKRSYESLEQLRNPNRLSDNELFALVRCPLGSIKNKHGRDWTTKKVAESIKEHTQLRVFSSLSMLGMMELGQSPLHPNARRWNETEIISKIYKLLHLASIPTTMVCDPRRSCA
jgi:hypothetical protein